MSASEELEQMAVRFANEAIQFDRQGSKSNAISRYERTVEILLKLCALYPEAPQNKLYMQQIENCKQRIRLLKEQNGRFEESDHTPRQPARLEQLVLTEKPNVKWNEIADLRDAKKAIEESIVFPVKRPDLFPLGWPRGILFFGPARQAAEVGKPVIIFIDEVDSLVGIRGDEVGGEVRTRNQFLKEMDNVLDKKRQTHVYVIGATNKPWALDEPFIRRFQKRIYVPLPTAESRQELYEIYAKNLKLASDVDRTLLVEKTEGYSGSDFRDIFQGAQTKVVREFFEGNHSKTQGQARAIAMDDFKDVLRKRKPSVSPQMLTLYDKWFETYKAL